MKETRFKEIYPKLFPLLCVKGIVKTSYLWELFPDKDAYASKILHASMRVLFKEKRVKRIKNGVWDILTPLEETEVGTTKVRKQLDMNCYKAFKPYRKDEI